MARLPRKAMIIALSALAPVALAACGGGNDNGSSGGGGGGGGGGGQAGGSITVLMGTAPDFIDPQEGYTTQSAGATWISYTGLLTYRHANGKAGTELIPGLAQAQPTVSADGKTYELTLRKGLVYSDGKPVKASDFEYTVRRLLKLNWGGKSFFTSYVKGASEYDTGKAQSVSGITTDDATGKITITLLKPYGAFANVLAFPSAGLVPTGTALKNLSNNPPPGVGPYMITNVVPNRSFTLVKNPKFAALKIPDIPLGKLDKITIKITSNTQSEAQQVLSNQADVFDAGDTLPPALLPQAERATDRFAREPVPSTFYFFLNTTKPPFNNQLAREAVNYAIDRRALQRLASGFLKPSCYFLPEGMVGHPTGPCKYGSLDKPDLAKAQALVKQAGLAGSKVTVWGQRRAPRTEYVDYYTSVLNKIGFKATEKILADATYFPTIGNEKSDPQTGFADWIQDFPNPSDFYLLLDAAAIQPTNNQNFSKVNDPKIQTELGKLNPRPATELDSAAADWTALDEYVANKAYVAVYGTQQVPKFFSNKVDFGSAVFHPVYYNDWSSLSLK
jgi:peptide/nickel transport system substrate-binding protein